MVKSPSDKKQNGSNEIDRIVHEPARYLIMAHLYIVDSSDFLFLKNQTGLTQGNLSSHLSKLETAGYVEIKKEFIGKRPHTMLSLTQQGRQALETYRTDMQNMLTNLPSVQ